MILKARSKDRRTLEEFEEHCAWVAQATPAKVRETDEERSARIDKARREFRFFVSYYFPHYAGSESPDFHVKAANVIRKHPVLR